MNRIDALRNEMEIKNLEAMLLKGEENIRYLSGFTGDSSWLLILKERGYLFTDGRFLEQAQKECKDIQALIWEQPERPHGKTIQKYLARHQVARLGFEEEKLSVSEFQKIKGEKDLVTWIPASGMVEGLRIVRGEEEIQKSKKACRIADEALRRVFNFIRPGMNERDLANELEYQLKKLGAEKEGFETICISGTHTSMPHGKPMNRAISSQGFLTLDFGAKYEGYISDMTRTFFIGNAGKEHKKVYERVKAAQQEGFEAMKAGVSTGQVDEVVRKVIGAEYLPYYYPGIGHGVGLTLHERPFIREGGTERLQKNTVMTVEPGIYIPDWGGVRIEDTVHILEDRAVHLTHFERDLIEIG